MTAPIPLRAPGYATRVGADGIDPCWRVIGARGDRSCPELQTVIRCINCAVYQDTAQRLLARLPTAIDAYDDELEDERELGERVNVLAFRLGEEWFGVPTRVLDEVGAPRPVHGVPHRRRGALLGLVNVRGTLTPCVSLARLLGLAEDVASEPSGDRPAKARLLVLRDGARQLAVPVDEVDAIHPVLSSRVDPAPATVAAATQAIATGMADCGRRRVGLLDIQRLLRALTGGIA